MTDYSVTYGITRTLAIVKFWFYVIVVRDELYNFMMSNFLF